MRQALYCGRRLRLRTPPSDYVSQRVDSPIVDVVIIDPVEEAVSAADVLPRSVGARVTPGVRTEGAGVGPEVSKST